MEVEMDDVAATNGVEEVQADGQDAQEMEAEEGGEDAGGASHTLYVNNIFEKLNQEDLRKAMRAIFGQFGPILDVVTRKTYRLRGQAWVVFEKAEDAQAAKEIMQGFPFYNKPIRIALANSKSDAVAKMDGTYVERPKEEQQQKHKEATEALLQRAKEKPAGSAAAASVNRILFVENLPPATNEAMLGMLFQQFTGFKEVRMVPQRPGIAFVEYSDDVQSSVALQGLQGFKLATDKPMKITYAKQ